MLTALSSTPGERATVSSQFEKDLDEVWNHFRQFLIDKIKKYGDAVLSPPHVFSKATPREQIAVYMDNKLARMLSRSEDDEDPQTDFVGYWFMDQIARLREARADGASSSEVEGYTFGEYFSKKR